MFFLQGYTACNDDTTVDFKITMTEKQMENANIKGGLLNKFKLTTTLSMANMHLLDGQGKLKKYDTPEQSKYIIHGQKKIDVCS